MNNYPLIKAILDVLTPGAPVVKERIQNLKNDQDRIARTLQILELSANQSFAESTTRAAEFKK